MGAPPTGAARGTVAKATRRAGTRQRCWWLVRHRARALHRGRRPRPVLGRRALGRQRPAWRGCVDLARLAPRCAAPVALTGRQLGSTPASRGRRTRPTRRARGRATEGVLKPVHLVATVVDQPGCGTTSTSACSRRAGTDSPRTCRAPTAAAAGGDAERTESDIGTAVLDLRVGGRPSTAGRSTCGPATAGGRRVARRPAAGRRGGWPACRAYSFGASLALHRLDRPSPAGPGDAARQRVVVRRRRPPVGATSW